MGRGKKTAAGKPVFTRGWHAGGKGSSPGGVHQISRIDDRPRGCGHPVGEHRTQGCVRARRRGKGKGKRGITG